MYTVVEFEEGRNLDSMNTLDSFDYVEDAIRYADGLGASTAYLKSTGDHSARVITPPRVVCVLNRAHYADGRPRIDIVYVKSITNDDVHLKFETE